MLQKYEIFLRFTNILTQKSRLSPDSQLQKTNYLKTNLLKQIKKISFTKECLTLSCEQRILHLSHVAKVKQNAELCKLFSNKKVVYAQKYHKKGMNTIIHPLICYIWFAKLYHQGLFRKHYSLFTIRSYIIPPIPGAPPIGIAGSFSGLSTIRHSVVRNIPAIEAAFSRATRATLAGSITPASRRSS